MRYHRNSNCKKLFTLQTGGSGTYPLTDWPAKTGQMSILGSNYISRYLLFKSTIWVDMSTKMINRQPSISSVIFDTHMIIFKQGVILQMAIFQDLVKLRGTFWHLNDQKTMLLRLNDIWHPYDDFFERGHITIDNNSGSSWAKGYFCHENGQWTLFVQIKDIWHLYDDFLKRDHITIDKNSGSKRAKGYFLARKWSLDNVCSD